MTKHAKHIFVQLTLCRIITFKKGQSGGLKHPLCAGSEEVSDHKGLLYASSPWIFAKRLFLYQQSLLISCTISRSMQEYLKYKYKLRNRHIFSNLHLNIYLIFGRGRNKQ
ncbi:hypothetical protein P3S68_019857 [Capsicum galapagoense]